jgi:hypothetical protein
MIRQIASMLQEIEPPLLLYSKATRLHLNEELRVQHHRRRMPILVSQIAHHRIILQEHRMARHILNHYHANFARPLVLSFLQRDLIYGF